MGWFSAALHILQVIAETLQSFRQQRLKNRIARDANDALEATNYRKVAKAAATRRRERLLRRGADSLRAPDEFARD